MPEGKYTVTFAQSARREIERLPANITNRIFPHIESLAQDPRPSGCRKLVGAERLWRVRVGDYRVIYEISDEERTVDVIMVRHRSEAYR